MRKFAGIVLGFFITSVLLSAIVQHCVPGLDALMAVAAAEPHESGEDHHHDGGSERGDCIIADAQAPTNLPSAISAPAPVVKILAVLWTAASFTAPQLIDQGPRLQDFVGSARASPPYAEAFARTGRLLI